MMNTEQNKALSALEVESMLQRPAAPGQVAQRMGVSHQKATVLLGWAVQEGYAKRTRAGGYIITEDGRRAAYDEAPVDPGSYRANHAWLRDEWGNYEGEFVFLHGGQLIDHDSNLRALSARLKEHPLKAEGLLVPPRREFDRVAEGRWF